MTAGIGDLKHASSICLDSEDSASGAGIIYQNELVSPDYLQCGGRSLPVDGPRQKTVRRYPTEESSGKGEGERGSVLIA